MCGHDQNIFPMTLSADHGGALLDYSAKLPSSAVLDHRYGANFLAIAVPKGQGGRLASVKEFVEEAKASGLLQQALERAGWRGFQLTDPTDPSAK